MLAYLLQMTICSAILYGYYHIFLRNEKFHQYNRFYLLASIVLSLVLPLFKIEFYLAADDGVIYRSIGSLNEGMIIISKKASDSWFTASSALYFMYGLIASFLIIRLVAAVRHIIEIKQKGERSKMDGITFILTHHNEAPFSFFNWLFWNSRIGLNSANGEQIFQHEIYHIRKKHSYDILFTEIVTALFWFNPVFYIVKKELKTIQEFLADRSASQNKDQTAYAELLLMQAMGTCTQRLMTPFFNNQLKRRIAMLTSSKKPGYQWLKKLLVLPLLITTAGMIIISCKNNSEPPERAETATVLADVAIQRDSVSLMDSLRQRISSDTVEGPVKVPVSARPGRPIPKQPEVYSKVDLSAQYPGNWRSFLEKNLDGNTAVKGGAPAGTYTAIVQFTVDKSGALDEVKALTKHGYGIEAEAVRVIKKSGKWKPAYQDGKTVKSYRKQPITFFVRQENAGQKPEASATSENRVVFTKVEVDARYPGNWRSFLERNLNGQVSVDNGAPAGTYTTIIQFIVGKDGTTSDFKALTKQGYGMEEEALRVIKASGKWIPAIQNGRQVKAYRKQPITFQIIDGTSGQQPVSKTRNTKIKVVAERKINTTYPNTWHRFLEQKALPANGC